MHYTFPKITKTLGFFIGIIVISLSLSYLVSAWTEPSANPPDPNVSTPLNIGSTGQSKSGGLILNTGGAPNGLIVQNGNVGIGTTNPTTGKLVVSGGNIDISGNKVINLATPTSSADAATKAYVDAAGGGGGGGDLFIPTGTYFLYGNGGAGDTAGTSVYYCLQKSVSGTGQVTNAAINENQPCDLSDSSKKCYLGTCVNVVWLTYSGATHTENQCATAGGTVTGSPTLCKFSSSGVSCPSGWTQADNWQKYSVAEWGTTDACGRWKSYGPTTFSNSIAHDYSRGSYQDCCSSDSCYGTWSEWNGSNYSRYGLNDVVNPSTNRLEVGCK